MLDEKAMKNERVNEFSRANLRHKESSQLLMNKVCAKVSP